MTAGCGADNDTGMRARQSVWCWDNRVSIAFRACLLTSSCASSRADWAPLDRDRATAGPAHRTDKDGQIIRISQPASFTVCSLAWQFSWTSQTNESQERRFQLHCARRTIPVKCLLCWLAVFAGTGQLTPNYRLRNGSQVSSTVAL